MRQEEKEMLYKDLCSRLPYGVKCEVYGRIGVLDEVTTFYGVGVTYSNGQDTTCRIDECKPYLFPISGMTVEQRCKVQSLLPDNCTISFTNSKFEFYGEDYHEIKLEQFEKIFNLFNMWHLDYRGLIPMGLAKDATGLNMY